MTILERKYVIGIPVETRELQDGDAMMVQANDFYRDVAAGQKFHAGLEVDNPDSVTVFSMTECVSSATFLKDQINKMDIRKLTRKKEPLIKRKIIWARE